MGTEHLGMQERGTEKVLKAGTAADRRVKQDVLCGEHVETRRWRSQIWLARSRALDQLGNDLLEGHVADRIHRLGADTGLLLSLDRADAQGKHDRARDERDYASLEPHAVGHLQASPLSRRTVEGPSQC